MSVRPAVAAALCSLAVAATAAAAGPAPSSTSTYPLESPASLLADSPIIEGGFSGLTPAAPGGRLFWTVTDRGPNGQPTLPAPLGQVRTFPVPAFTPAIRLVTISPTRGLVSLATIPLRLRAGATDPARVAMALGGNPRNITGFPNLPATGGTIADEFGTLADGSPFDAAGKPVGLLDPYGLDTEGIAVSSDGFWISDEYRPSLVHVSFSGVILERLVPAGTPTLGDESVVPVRRVLPAIYSKRRANRGIEGVALSNNGRYLYALLQNALDTKAATTSDGVAIPGGTTPKLHRSLRLVEIDLRAKGGPVVNREFLYQIDANDNPRPADVSAADWQDLYRTSDIAWIGPSRIAVDDRDDAPAGGGTDHKVIYAVDLSRGTDLTTLPAGSVAAVDRDTGALDAYTPELLAAAGITPAPKTPILDVGATYPHDKLEGVALVGRDRVAVVNDNDFGLGAQLNALPPAYEAKDPAGTDLTLYRVPRFR